MHTLLKYTLSLIAAAALSSSAFATIFWDWSIVEPHQVIAPTDIAHFQATLTNKATSDENLIFNIETDTDKSGFNILAGGIGFLAGTFEYVSGRWPHNKEVWAQFIGLDLAPSESFTFDWGTFYPISGSAPDGYVLTNNAGLTVVPNDESRNDVFPKTDISREWSIRVDASVTPT